MAVFGPMKGEWRKVVREWKESCELEGKIYATLPKEHFPKMLSKLLEKSYKDSIISGFRVKIPVPIITYH